MTTSRDTTSDLWAITSYYNPAGYRRRRENFTQFRSHLNVPLLAVELAPPGRGELAESDAEILLSLEGNEVLWQKERLLNIGLAQLPPHVKYVAWLDADVVLPNTQWPAQARAALESAQLVQPFTHAYHLERDDALETFHAQPSRATGTAVAHMLRDESYSPAHLSPISNKYSRACACGLAWVARRELLEEHGWYDAMICGSGDRAMALAAAGHFDLARNYLDMDERSEAHYLAWARPFYAAVQGKLAALPSDLVHLWHGELKNRRYTDRYDRLRQLAFDPAVDLFTAPAGQLRLRKERQDVQEYMREYFAGRLEDG